MGGGAFWKMVVAFPCQLTAVLMQSPSSASSQPLQIMECCFVVVSTQPSLLLKAGQPQLSQPVFVGELLQASYQQIILVAEL